MEPHCLGAKTGDLSLSKTHKGHSLNSGDLLVCPDPNLHLFSEVAAIPIRSSSQWGVLGRAGVPTGLSLLHTGGSLWACENLSVQPNCKQIYFFYLLEPGFLLIRSLGVCNFVSI